MLDEIRRWLTESDEQHLLLAVWFAGSENEWPAHMLMRLDFAKLIPFKRALYILEKWERSGIWESGVSTRSGWLTPAGIAAAEQLWGAVYHA